MRTVSDGIKTDARMKFPPKTSRITYLPGIAQPDICDLEIILGEELPQSRFNFDKVFVGVQVSDKQRKP